MAAVTLTPKDLAPFADIPEAKALAMIEDAMALAATVAPCLTEPGFDRAGAAKAILRGAVLRWNDAGSGALRTAAVDDVSFGFETSGQRRSLFWPSEITQLQNLCKESSSGAYAVDTIGAPLEQHADICALRFGAQYCSCGAVLTMNLPLYENL